LQLTAISAAFIRKTWMLDALCARRLMAGVRRLTFFSSRRILVGYYMRFIVTDEKDASLSVLEMALKHIDSAYLIERDEESDSEGLLKCGNEVYGQIEVNLPGDGLFDREIEELKDFVKSSEGAKQPEVLNVLAQAKAIVAVRVLDQGREGEETLVKIDPLWQWLFANRQGLLQASGEGYYDASGLILEVT
jgi:hypothetical protein